jgi:ATP phosphoribosyltransferase regulatory subunit
LARAGLSAAGQKRAEQAAAKKDLPKLHEILRQEQISVRFARMILEAPELSGNADVIARGRRLAGKDSTLTKSLDRLAHVYHLLSDAGYQDVLFLDLGEFRGFDYYDGIVFDVFAEGIGVELGGGGRYNHLIGRFGRNIPSTGFALNVDRVFRGLSLSRHQAEARTVHQDAGVGERHP